MIRAENLHKRYGDVRAVDGVSFEVRQGEIYGLLGPNGAGKTTTLSMLAGLLPPDEGRILFEEVDLAAQPVAVKRHLGVVPQEVALYEELTGRENLRFWGGLYGLSGNALKQAVERALGQVGLTGKADTRVKTYSGGMKRRLNLSLGLVHSPRIVLMDEPTVGIDPQARANILDVVRDVAAAGTTVLYTTHYLEEAETLCERIGIMDEGRILAEGTLEELKRMLGDGELITVRGSFDAETARSRLGELPGVRVLGAEQGRLVLSAAGDGKVAVELLSRVLGSDLGVDGVSIQPPSLNSLFLKLTGRELRD
jgi:ABC-2 type transport system ATP-binding protein